MTAKREKTEFRKPSKARAGAPKKCAATKASRATDSPGGRSTDWRADTLAAIRRLIHEADPAIVEERKWVKPSNPSGVPVWSHDGIVCTGESYKAVVKLTFARGAALQDPGRLFNASLEGNARRAIDIREGERLDVEAFKALIQDAVEVNRQVRAAKSKGRVGG